MSEPVLFPFRRQHRDCEVRTRSTVVPAAVPLRILVASLLLWVTACTDGAQDPGSRNPLPELPLEPLDPPTAVFAEDFGYVHAVRELPDGDVVVVDLYERAVFRVDMEAQTRTVVGSRGSGPEEYLQPDAVWSLPGDSTLLVDLGNGRLFRLGPNLEFGATRSAAVQTDAGGMVLAVPTAVDGRGRIYTAPEPWPPTQADTATVIRIDPVGGSVDRLRTVTTKWSGVLFPHDAWGVASDGSLVVARSEAYGVDWLSPDGVLIRGDPVPHVPIRVTTSRKEEFYRELERHSRVIRGVLSGPGGSVVSLRYQDNQDPERYERGTWPDVMPAFRYQVVRVDPLDRAWVLRYDPAASDSPYDIFDRQGQLVRRIVAEGDRRVAGFGGESIYMVAFDEFDRAFLERYPLPGS